MPLNKKEKAAIAKSREEASAEMAKILDMTPDERIEKVKKESGYRFKETTKTKQREEALWVLLRWVIYSVVPEELMAD